MLFVSLANKGYHDVGHLVGVTIFFRPSVYMCMNEHAFSCFHISVWVCLPLDICMHGPVHVYVFARMRMHMGMHANQIYPCVCTSTCVISRRHNIWSLPRTFVSRTVPDGKGYGANMGPAWGRQHPGGPHVGPMNLAIWAMQTSHPYT